MWLRARGSREFCIRSAPQTLGSSLDSAHGSSLHTAELQLLFNCSLKLRVRDCLGPSKLLSLRVHPKLLGCQDWVLCLWERPGLSVPSVVLAYWIEMPKSYIHREHLGGSWWRDSQSMFMCLTYQRKCNIYKGGLGMMVSGTQALRQYHGAHDRCAKTASF